MSYDSKIASARQIVEKHNSNVVEGSKIVFDDFLEKLRNLGGTSEETLQAASWEDLQHCGIPQMMARRLTHLFRQKADGNGGKSIYVSDRKAKMMTPKELLERYNPKDVKNSVGKRLKDLSDGKHCIVFDNDCKVIVDVSYKLLDDIMDGLPELMTTHVDGRPTPVYEIGERPDFYAEENPIYPGRALRSRETCDQTGRSWEGVDIDIRQLLWIAVEETEELLIETVANAHDILDKVLAKNSSLDSIRSRYPDASLKFDEASKVGNLPILKIKIGSEVSQKSNNPFGENTAY